MKILELSLAAYGPFSGEILNLDRGEQGLHIVYGPNEAGKSTTLRALKSLLFGIPERTEDNHLHAYDQLRLGGRLRSRDGNALAFIRRKGRKDTLLDAETGAPLPASALDPFLAGIDEAIFGKLFAIDHAALREGGHEIAAGQGDLGKVLFAASSGLASVSTVQKELQESAGGLFKRAGKTKPRIVQSLAQFQEASATLRQAQLPSEEWLRRDSALREARQRQGELEARIAEHLRERHRWTRLQSALPAATRRREILAVAESLANVPRLRPGFAEARRDAQERVRSSQRRRDDALAHVAEIERQLEALVVPDDLLARRDEIRRANQRLGEHEKAQKDRHRIEQFLDDHEREARHILRALDLPIEHDDSTSIGLRPDEVVAVRDLGSRLLALREARQRESQAVEASRSELELLEAPDDQPAHDLEAAHAAFAQAQALGNLDAEADSARSVLQEAERRVAEAIRALPGWDRPVRELASLSIPLDPSIAAYEQLFRDLDSSAREIEAEHRRLVEHLESLERELSKIEASGTVPTEPELERSRERRQRGWRLVRQDWLLGQHDTAAASAFIDETAPGNTLAEAFERSILDADVLADALRRDADRSARKVQTTDEAARVRARLTELAESRGALRVRLDAVKAEWASHLPTPGLQAFSPPELRAWLAQRSVVLDRLTALETARGAVAGVERSKAEARVSLARVLEVIGARDVGLPEAHTEALDLVRRRLAVVDEAARAVERRREERRRLEIALRKAAKSHEAAESALGQSTTEWARFMAKLRLEAEASPAQANSVLDQLQALAQAQGKASEFRSRLRGIDRDAETFRADVENLVGMLAPDLSGQPTETAVLQLGARLEAAVARDRDRENARTQLDEWRTEASTAQQEMAAARDELAQLCAEAGCSDPEGLPAVEDAARRRDEAEAALAACDDDLTGHAAGASLRDFLAELEACDADGLAPRIDQLDREVAELQSELKAASEAVGTERTTLATMDGAGGGVDAADQVESILARLRGEVPAFALLQLSSAVLRRAIESHREKSQGPLIERASQLFARLTGGSFEALRVDVGDDDRTILTGLRDGGRAVRVDGMSDGTRDQLYLAMRIAGLEHWMRSREALPFVIDDVLLNFDNDRSIAALETLGELSRSTQVIYFTHHEHLLEMAEANLDADVLFTYRLARSGARRSLDF